VAGSVGGNNNGYVLVFSKKNHNILKKIECARHNVPDSISFSADQSELILGGCHYNEVEAYNVQTGHMTFQTQVDSGSWIYNFISYNTNGSLIAIGSSDGGSGTITLLKAEDGSIAGTLPRELATITNMQWLNDHLILVSYDGWNPGGSVAIIWDTNSKSIAAEFRGKHLQLASISPDGHQLAAIIGNDVYIGNLQNMNPGN
jgi:WD40 repeat protein